MNFLEGLLHFFTPRHTNNHRAKALSTSSLFSYVIFLLLIQVGMTFVLRFKPEILGYATNITIEDLLKDTNTKRAENGLAALSINEKLAQAANDKAKDMFANQYWAHTSPSGKDPWEFILNDGYTYLYAGENLARDFPDSKSVVDAWMNSPSHRDNLLNSRYKEVGFAVLNGKYGDYETTVVVQMFGTRPAGEATVEVPEKPVLSVATAPAVTANNVSRPVSQNSFNIFAVTRVVSIILTALLVIVLAIDAFLVWRRGTIRISGHNLAHMMILIVLLVALNIISRGVII